MPKKQPPLPSLDELQRKIDAATPKAQNEEAPTAAKGMNQGMRMGVELVAGVGVGALAGYFIDRWLHTMPLFFIICFFLGAAAGFKNMIRSAKEMTDDTTND